jgi:hypothetical protein
MIYMPATLISRSVSNSLKGSWPNQPFRSWSRAGSWDRSFALSQSWSCSEPRTESKSRTNGGRCLKVSISRTYTWS